LIEAPGVARRFAGASSFQQFRQLGDVARYSPSLILCQHLRYDLEAACDLLNGPGLVGKDYMKRAPTEADAFKLSG
jgi:hypothetical protein